MAEDTDLFIRISAGAEYLQAFWTWVEWIGIDGYRLRGYEAIER